MREDPSALKAVLDYHQRTKHHLDRYARSLGYLDWANQPDPFLRYDGADLVPLDEIPPGGEPSYDDLFQTGGLPARPLDRDSISQLFYDSLALSAWKEQGEARWSLRVNPSSGNLHPTEGYLLAGPIPGLLERPALCHYSPYHHGLEVRALVPDRSWDELAGTLPPDCVLIGLTSIHWREAWKYGERAFRYCQHDAGHALAAIALAARALGWEARLVDSLTDAELETLLGISGQDGLEAEHPDLLTAVCPAGAWRRNRPVRLRPPDGWLESFGRIPLLGRRNRLSPDHHPWPVIDQVAAACRRVDLPPDETGESQVVRRETPARISLCGAREIIRGRRSAVAMDGTTSISRETFSGLLRRVVPEPGAAPFDGLPWRPAVHLALFVHRVDGLEAGLYLLVRRPEAREELRAALKPDFDWTPPPECPGDLPLFRLLQADCRNAAQAASCHQAIASDGAFAVGMIAEFEPLLERYGPWFYRGLHWETGAIGQVLYLEAEAASVRGTGIGCFFDDAMHDLLGLDGRRYQVLYHFTVGGPVEDPRLKTRPAYEHRRSRPGNPP
jgi:SagB-type dehydrogenase family enzyme